MKFVKIKIITIFEIIFKRIFKVIFEKKKFEIAVKITKVEVVIFNIVENAIISKTIIEIIMILLNIYLI